MKKVTYPQPPPPPPPRNWAKEIGNKATTNDIAVNILARLFDLGLIWEI
jgi:hypothetical protein